MTSDQITGIAFGVCVALLLWTILGGWAAMARSK